MLRFFDIKPLLLSVFVVLSACGQSAQQNTASSHPSTETPLASPITPASATGCQLPIAQDPRSRNGKGAFVSYPSGAVTAEATALFEPVGSNGLVRSVTKPYLYGWEGRATFTRRFGRWLPAILADVSPDSSHYAYSETGSPRNRIHVVDVVSGGDRVVRDQVVRVVGDAGNYHVLDYQAEGIYVVDVGPTGEAARGLFLLDPASGALRTVAGLAQPETSRYGFSLIGGGGAWYTDLAPGDRPPYGGIAPVDRLVRFDLKTRAVTPWFRREGLEVQGLGFDEEGHPVVQAYLTSDGLNRRSIELWLVTAPNVGKQIYSGPGDTSPDFTQFYGAPLADAHGLWIGSNKGIFLYNAATGLQKISLAVGSIAGRCS